MALASTFMGGAAGRLLAPSIPFRFFASAVLFHVLAWPSLFIAAPAVADFAGGLGWTLAALHMITLGVLVMTAVGASLQLLPVATRQLLGAASWPYHLLWSLYTFGVLALTGAMAIVAPALVWAGAWAVVASLLLYLFMLVRNLHAAKGMRLVVLHAWAAGLSLLVLLATGLSLAGAYSGVIFLERQMAAGLHVSFAGYGFMGLLVMGFSYILVPMFALSDNPAPGWSRLSLGLALAALATTFLVWIGSLPMSIFGTSIAAAGLAFVIHVALMERALRTGLRRSLGSSFVLVRIGWFCLTANLGLALALQLEFAIHHGAVLFGTLLLTGLLSLLLGMLSRIVPFLAAMHAGAGMRRPPTPSTMTMQRALDIHLYCHSAALLMLLAGIWFDSVWLLRVGATTGALGAGAYAVFFFKVWHRMRQMLQKKGLPGDSKPT